MTPDQQRIAIATACGWRCNGHPDQLAATVGWEFAYQFVLTPEGKLVTHNSIPDYLNDLNAMHEAEKVLIKKGVNAWWAYVANINRNNPRPFGSESAVHATAAQRSEALLRTLELWQPTPTQPQ
jgi:hypothetical protein